MDKHINLFYFFDESDNSQYIENNLSRAFALCLRNDNIFFYEYIKSILDEDDYNFALSEDSNLSVDIDIQKNIDNIEKEDYTKVYAIAMTTNENLSMLDFLQQEKISKDRDITDIFISIKSIAIIIEVKKTDEDCRKQLFNQVADFNKFNKDVIRAKSFSWQKIVELLEKVKNIRKLHSKSNVFINDFLNLISIKFPEWFNTKPLSNLSFYSKEQLFSRIREAVVKSKQVLLSDKYDREGIQISFRWASEIIPYFEQIENIDMVVFRIWPGNTKIQAIEIFNQSLDWTLKDHLLLNNRQYKLKIRYDISFRHFSKSITDLIFIKSDLIESKEIYTKENLKNTKKWDREKWNELEEFLDSYFKTEFNWREKCDWDKNFINSKRTYLTISFGYEVSLYVPFADIKEIDKGNEGLENLANFITDLVKVFESLILNE